jgi:hypothetical protein
MKSRTAGTKAKAVFGSSLHIVSILGHHRYDHWHTELKEVSMAFEPNLTYDLGGTATAVLLSPAILSDWPPEDFDSAPPKLSLNSHRSPPKNT